MQFVSKKMVFCVGLVWLASTSSLFGQDFQKNYPLTDGGGISVQNISGDVTVTGYDGQTVLVLGYKEGRDRERVTIEESLAENNLSIRIRYPRNCNCQASARFDVKVPRARNFRFDSITSVSGDVEVSGVTGKVDAKSISGNVVVREVTGSVAAKSTSGNVMLGEIKGPVNAASVSGDVEVTILQLGSGQDMDFTSISGDVDVRVPASLDAEVKMTTMSGSLKTDLPLTIEKDRFSPGRRASGRIGAGTLRLKISSISGDVSLRRT
jgi:hypothetical protein